MKDTKGRQENSHEIKRHSLKRVRENVAEVDARRYRRRNPSSGQRQKALQVRQRVQKLSYMTQNRLGYIPC
jgi:hypothetical protein